MPTQLKALESNANVCIERRRVFLQCLWICLETLAWQCKGVKFNSHGIICATFRPRVWNTFFSLSVKPKLISYWQPTANINNGWSCGWMLETPKVLDRTCLRRYRGPLCLHLKIPSSLWRVLFVRLLREDKRFWSLSNRQLFSVKGYLVVNQKRFKKFNL